MVKVELCYNPYLLELNIKVDGQIPGINSLVEKCQKNILQIWIDEISAVFCGEMKEYDFEIEFTGTKLDFDDVKEAFLKAGADENLVTIFHKNELECRYLKMQSIVNLLQWFESNRNRRFDYAMFLEKNEEFLQKYFKCAVINGFHNVDALFKEYPMMVEAVDDAHELEKTKLFHIPLLICIDQKSVENLEFNVNYFILRKDVNQEQLFFIIQPSLDAANIERTIKDLGVISPKIITNAKDKKVKKYLEIYPVTDYIYNVIQLLRENEKIIAAELHKENTESAIKNRTIHNRIDELEDIIKRLKETAEKFSERENFKLSVEMWKAKSTFIERILNWKDKKIKITKESDAVVKAQELDELLGRWYQEFNEKILNIAADSQSAIEIEFKEWYSQAEFDIEYEPKVYRILNLKSRELPKISAELLKLKEKRYVMKEDLFGKWFKSYEDKVLETVFETAFFYQKWRDYAIGIVEPIADGIIRRYEERLKNYSSEMAEKYRQHLEKLISEQTRIREEAVAQLSEDELKLQRDNEWLMEFQEQLRSIERG